jgi:replicative DNA helicase
MSGRSAARADLRPSGPDEASSPPPHSIEAEQAVLGAVMLDNAALDKVSDVLRVEDFFDPAHRAIYGAIRGLVLAHKVADVITVGEASGHSMSALNSLCQSVPSAQGAATYARIVRERANERALMGIGQALAVAAADPQRTLAQKIDGAMTALARVADGSASRESVTLQAAIAEFVERMSAEAEGRTRCIQTGLNALDRMLAGGLREGELMVIGGRPKMGKTALVLTLARNMATRYGVLLLSQEMPANELVARNTAALGSLNLASLRQPSEMRPDDWARMSDAIERMRSMSMIIDDQRALTLGDVRRKLMAAKRMASIDVVVVDFLQLMNGEGDNRNSELDRIANGLKALAGEFGVAVILLSAMSREADKRHGPPVMTDLRDSGAIEAAADIIALLYREYAHPLGQHTEDWRNHAQLEIVQRNGAPGSINLWFSGEYQQFADWEGHTPFRKVSSRSTGKGMD